MQDTGPAEGVFHWSSENYSKNTVVFHERKNGNYFSLNMWAADNFSLAIMLFLAIPMSFNKPNYSRKVINYFVFYSKLYVETLVDFQYPESGKVVRISRTYSPGPGIDLHFNTQCTYIFQNCAPIIKGNY